MSARGHAAPPGGARRLAYDVLAAVRERDSYANLLLPTLLARSRLSPADARFATELCYGTLRLQGRYDAILARCSSRAPSRIDPRVRDVLRLGAHQLLSMRVPKHAAVHETVELAGHVGASRARGFCNAVLRAVARHDADEWTAVLAEGATGRLARLSACHSHPEWVVDALDAALALDGRTGELEDLLEADNRSPAVTAIDLEALGGPGRPDSEGGLLSPYARLLAAGDPSGELDTSAGWIRVQDAGSQVAALALSRAREVRCGERWLDLCAGPGGKAAVLAVEAARGGARLEANEPAAARAELVRRALASLPGDTVVGRRDGTVVGTEDPGGYDRILLDAPCSGLGALRRRPEARWRRRPEDLPGLVGLQAALADSAVRALADGGLLAYVTCSPHVDETRAQIAGLLERWEGELTPLDTAATLRTVCGAGSELRGRQVQLWPHVHGTDAMFIALLEKRPARTEG